MATRMGSLPIDTFFAGIHERGEMVTYGDVTLGGGPSSVATSEMDISSRFSRNFRVALPLASAAMATVTPDSRMAIAVELRGGIGVLHAGLPAEEQLSELKKIKYKLNGVVERPITVHPEQTIGAINNLCEEKGWTFRSFPVTDTNDKFLGLLTESDIKRAFDYETVADFMTRREDVITATNGMTPQQAHELMRQERVNVLPLLHNGFITGLYTMKDAKRIVEGTNASVDGHHRLLGVIAIPSNIEEALRRLDMMKGLVDIAIIDSSRGGTDYVLDTLLACRNAYPQDQGLDIGAGNIDNPEAALKLAAAKPDLLKDGVGSGAICKTASQTGVYTAQMTSVYECSTALKEEGYDIPLCADGGIRHPGDVPKALAVGAESVMMGRAFAGTDETGLTPTAVNGKLVMEYTGEGSNKMKQRYASARARYNSGKGPSLEEGIEGSVEYKGSVDRVLVEYELAIRAAFELTGSATVDQFKERARLRELSAAAREEYLPHDV